MHHSEARAGDRVGKLTIVGPGEGHAQHTGSGPWFLCRCDCGTVKSIWWHALLKPVNAVQSCGCVKRSREFRAARSAASGQHGHSRRSPLLGLKPTKEYRTWCGIIRRCENPREQNYARYGGRGITICAAWRASFPAFLADVGPCPDPGYSIDRVDPNGPYAPGNTRWVPLREQAANTRSTRYLTHDGRTQHLSAWERETGIKRTTIAARIDTCGWSVARALSTPTRR